MTLRTPVAALLALSAVACGDESSPTSSTPIIPGLGSPDAATLPVDSGTSPASDAAVAFDGSTSADGSTTSDGAAALDAAVLPDAAAGDGSVTDATMDGATSDAGGDAATTDAATGDAAVDAADGDATTIACTRCTGPGDWTAGDYPPELREQVYLEITGVPGQGDAVRGYKVHVPPSYDPQVAMPVLFAMHGLGQNPILYPLDGSAWLEKADEEGFIVVMPSGNAKGADGTWSFTGSWNAGECCGGAAQAGIDDVALIRAIADEVGGHLNLDLTRVYATGMSNGGFLSYRLACEASDLFVAVAPGAGAIGMPSIAPMGTGNADFTVCEPDNAVSVLAMHGTADALVPYRFYEPSLAHMAEQNGCATTTTAASVPASGGDTTCITYEGCPSGVSVSGCTVDGGGHCWFGDPSCGTGVEGIGNAFVGNDSDFLDSTDAAWEFLSQHHR